MEIRDVREDELDEFAYIGRQAFAHGERSSSNWMRDPNRPAMDMIGAFDDAGMQARLVVIAYRVHLGAETIVPMGGIGGVACLPASRGKGYAGMLLKAALERMRDNGQVLSSLYPFSWDFYRRHGWEWVGLERAYTVPSRIFKEHPETENIRAAKPDDRPAIIDCYTQFARRYRGLVERSEKRWGSLLDDEEKKYTYTYLYEQAGKVEGYLVIRGGTGEKTDIEEFIVLTARARTGMLGLLRRQEMQTDKFAWRAPFDDPLYFQLCHNDTETRIEPMTQGRVVDVAGAFAAWKPDAPARGAVNLSVTDERAPWNTGVWRVEFEGGEVSIRRTDAEPHLSLDIQALSQAYYGTPTIAEIRAAERLTVHDENGYESFRTLLDGPPMWTLDHF